MDADALLEHSRHVAEARAELFRNFADSHTMTFYSEPSPALAQALEAMAGAVEVKQFSFLQALNTGVEVLRKSRLGGTRRVTRRVGKEWYR